MAWGDMLVDVPLLGVDAHSVGLCGGGELLDRGEADTFRAPLCHGLGAVEVFHVYPPVRG